MSRGTRRILNFLLVIAVLLFVWVALRVYQACRQAELFAAEASSYALQVGSSGGEDGSCAGYWDDYPEGFHWLRDDGVWVH